MDSLSQFAIDTKHRPHQIQTVDDIDQLRRKLIATQLPTFSLVYPFISDDLASINFRAPNSMERFKADSEYMKMILSPENVMIDEKPTKRTDLMEHLMNAEPMEAGALINSMSWPNLGELVACGVCGGKKEKQKKKEEEAKKELLKQRMVELPINEPITIDFSNNQTIKQFKLNAAIGTRFPSENCAKQILISNVAPGEDVSHLYGKMQRSVPPTPLDASILALVDTYSKETIAALVATEQAQDLYYALVGEKPKSGQELIKQLFDGGGEVHKRYQKKYGGKIKSQIVELIKN